MLIIIAMRDGIFSFYVRSDETAFRAIAIVENDSIRGFNRSHIYSLERLKYSINRLRKDRNTNWRVKVMEHSPVQGFSMRGFPAKLKGEEGEEQFCFEGGSDADRRVRAPMQGHCYFIVLMCMGKVSPLPTKICCFNANLHHFPVCEASGDQG